MEILVPGNFTYSGAVNNGADVFGQVPFTVSGPSCGEIMADLNDYQSSSNYYPVECDFVSLSSSGVVFFMDANTQQLGNSLLVQVTQAETVSFTDEDLDYIFMTQGGFTVFLLVALTFMRQVRKFRFRNSPLKPL